MQRRSTVERNAGAVERGELFEQRFALVGVIEQREVGEADGRLRSEVKADAELGHGQRRAGRLPREVGERCVGPR